MPILHFSQAGFILRYIAEALQRQSSSV